MAVRVTGRWRSASAGLEQTLAAFPATASDLPFPIGHVVVGQLFASPDGTRRADPDDVADDMDVAVAFARMIDEARYVAVHGGIAYPAPVDLKAPDGAPLHVPVFASEALLLGDLLARVVDNPGIFRDRSGGKDSPTM